METINARKMLERYARKIKTTVIRTLLSLGVVEILMDYIRENCNIVRELSGKCQGISTGVVRGNPARDFTVYVVLMKLNLGTPVMLSPPCVVATCICITLQCLLLKNKLSPKVHIDCIIFETDLWILIIHDSLRTLGTKILFPG